MEQLVQFDEIACGCRVVHYEMHVPCSSVTVCLFIEVMNLEVLFIL